MFLAAILAVSVSLQGNSPSAKCLAELRALGASADYAWAWTYPWFWHDALRSDLRNAVEKDGVFLPKPLAETVLETPKGRAELKLEEQFGILPRYYYLDFFYLTGSLRPSAYYAANRASVTAVVRKAWQQYRAVPVFSWHMEHPCTTNGFGKMAYRYQCADHTNLVRAVVNDEQDGKLMARAWFVARLTDISSFLNGLVDEQGAKIPVIIRYAHEMDGGWFWWGKGHCSNVEYIAFSRIEADFLWAQCGRDQILFAFTPDRHWRELGEESKSGYLTWYPGDAYVNILGYDDYGIGGGKTRKDREKNFNNTLSKLRILSAYAANRNQAVILSESGAPSSGSFYKDLHRVLTSKGVHVAFANTWIGPWTWPKTEEGLSDLKAYVEQNKTKVCIVKESVL